MVVEDRREVGKEFVKSAGEKFKESSYLTLIFRCFGRSVDEISRTAHTADFP